jgi:hypothetical protein
MKHLLFLACAYNTAYIFVCIQSRVQDLKNPPDGPIHTRLSDKSPRDCASANYCCTQEGASQNNYNNIV